MNLTEDTRNTTFLVSCKECCWQFSTSWEPRAAAKADEHTQDTGHRTDVSEDTPKRRWNDR